MIEVQIQSRLVDGWKGKKEAGKGEDMGAARKI